MFSSASALRRRSFAVLVPALVVAFFAFAPVAFAQTFYPPGPGNSCPDTLKISNLQDAGATCHPAVLDRVLGIPGIVTAIDAIPTGFGLYIQNSQGGAYSGIDVFTGATNYATFPYYFAVGDSIVVYGRTQEFPTVNGVSEIEGPDGIQATNDIVIRKVSSGNPLPPFQVLTPAQASWVYNAGGGQGELWEGCLVRVRGPLVVIRTTLSPGTTQVGMFTNSVLLAPSADTSNVNARVLVDCSTLTAIAPLAMGTLVDSLQGVVNQRVVSAISTYSVELRSAADLFAAVPPSVLTAYALSSNTVRVEFDRNLDVASATNAVNYGGLGVTSAVVEGGAGRFVQLTVAATPASLSTLTVSNVASLGCPSCTMTAQAVGLWTGVFSVHVMQIPDPAYLPNEDRSRYAGALATPGYELSLSGTCTGVFGSLYYVQDEIGGTRTGISVFAPVSPLAVGHRYLLNGRVQEFGRETEVISTSYVQDLGAGVIPTPPVVSVAVLSDTSQSGFVGFENYEGMVVTARDAQIVSTSGAGGAFVIAGPYGTWTSQLGLTNLNGVLDGYTPPASPQVVTATGVMHQNGSSYTMAPRSGADIFVDATAPTAQFTRGPANGATIITNSATFGWTGSDDHSTLAELQFASSFNGGAYGAWATDTSLALSALGDASYTLAVKAKDRTGNIGSPASRTFIVHKVAPAVTIVAGPAAGAWSNASPSFTWSSTLSPVATSVSYATQLDGGVFSAEGSGTSLALPSLAPGGHTLVVRATDDVGLQGTATRAWTVDAMPPTVAFTSGPAANSWIATTSATFNWSANDAGAGGVLTTYRLDAGAWSTYGTGTTASLTGLAAGAHQLDVKAVDAVGNETALSCPFNTAGLVSWWPADGAASDAWGGNNGTLTGGVTYAAGRRGQALSFDGTTGYVTVPDNASLDPLTGSFTIEGWVNSSSSSPNQVVLSKYEGGLECAGSPKSAYYLSLENGAATIYVRDSDGGGNVSEGQQLTGPTLNDGLWHYLVGSRDVAAGTLNLYVDGSLVVSQPLNAGASGSIQNDDGHPDPLTIGAFINNCTAQRIEFFSGSIDEVAYSSRALSAGDVAAIYAAGGRAPCAAAASRQFTVDTQAPDTQILAGPAEGSTSFLRDTSLVVTGSDDLAPVGQLQFRWRDNAGAWSAFSASTTVHLAGLALGSHAIEVQAQDLAGNTDPTPAIRNFTVQVPPHTITASVTGLGAISPSGAVSVADAADQTFTLTAPGGVSLTGLVVDGVAVTPVPNFKFANVTADHTIAAAYVQWGNPGDVLVADQGAKKLVRIDPATAAQTVISSGGSFSNPSFVGVNSAGQIFVVDYSAAGGSGALFRIDPSNGSQAVFGSGGFFVDPSGFTFDSNGDILLADASSTGHEILRLNGSTGAQTVVSGGNLLRHPQDLKLGPSGDLFVADYAAFGGNGGVIRINLSTGAQTALASGGLFAGSTAAVDLAFMQDGDLVVTNASPAAVVRVDATTGAQSLIASGGYLASPAGVAVASNGDLLIGDKSALGGGGAVIRVNPTSGVQLAALTGSNFLDPYGLAVASGTPTATGDLAVAGAMQLNGASAFANVTVSGAGALTVTGSLSASGNMTIQPGGVVTHVVRDTAGLVLNVTGTLDVQNGGTIDVTARGLAGGTGLAPGETFGGTGAIVAGAGGSSTYGAGASYGGQGVNSSDANTNAAYGLIEDPRQLGSGGGGSAGATGGAGGGRVRITAAALVLNGTIRADGGAGQHGSGTSGAGSGGAIRIDAGSVSGTTGLVSAVGGDGVGGWQSAAPGGGGRIAIGYGTMTLPASNVKAGSGSTGGYGGAAGTVYLKDAAQTAGDLTIDNAMVMALVPPHRTTPLLTSLSQMRSVAIRNHGDLELRSGDVLVGSTLAVSAQVNSSLTVDRGASFAPASLLVWGSGTVVTDSTDLAFAAQGNLQIQEGGRLNICGGAVLSLPTFDGSSMQGGAVVVIDSGCRFDVASGNVATGNGTFVMNGKFGTNNTLGALTVNGTLTGASQDTAGLVLNVTGTLTVNGRIDVSSGGLLGGNRGTAFGARGQAFDPITGAIIAGAFGSGDSAAGGSYGGAGGAGPVASNAPYGLLEDASQLGAGGGGAGVVPGGNGGGRVHITAPNMVLRGSIYANGGDGGQSGTARSGAGSGGSIRLDVGALSGGGQLWARGGGGGGAYGTGSGGRIAVYYSSSTMALSDNQMLADPGNGPMMQGSAGTVYMKDRALAAGDVLFLGIGVGMGMTSPLLTSLPKLHEVILTYVRLDLDATQRTTSWADYITLSNATLSAPDTLLLQGTILRGSGTIATRLVNFGEISPGGAANPVGQIVCAAGYRQGATGVLRADISSASAYDQLRVMGDADLGGQLAYQYLNSYAPPPGTRFPVMSYGTHTGSFATVAGADTSTAVVYSDTTAAVIKRLEHTPPQTAFVSGLADGAWTNSTSQPFGWSGTDDTTLPAALLYSYQLDSGGWSTLSGATSHVFTGLTAGLHTVSVYAVDESGNADPTPATRTFTVDLLAPALVYGSGPAEGDTVRSEPVSFTLRGSDDRSPVSALTYSYSLDGAAYTTPAADTTVSLGGLGNGTHTLASRVLDLAGNVGTPVTRSWVHLMSPRDLVVASALTLTRDTTFNSITVQSGGTLTADGAVTVLTNMTVASGGVVTHAVRDTAGLRLDVSGTLTVDAGGLIDLDEKGLLGGSGGNSPGETFDGSDNIVAGAGSGGTWAAGASYGGSGGDGHQGVTGAPYGLLENPRYLGAGGGGAASAPRPNGGGRLRVSAGAMVVNGIVRADGASGQFPNGVSGGGAGGSIRLDVGTLSGSGTITAKGGNGANGGQWYSGAGGGGRIAVYYATLGLPSANFVVAGGTGSSPGGAGTIYLKDNAASNGDVIVDAGDVASSLVTRLMTGASSFRTMTARNHARVNVVASDVPASAITQQLQVAGNSVMTVNAGVTLTFTGGAGYQLEVQGGGTLTAGSGSALASSGSGLAVEVQGGSTLTVAAGATWGPSRVRVNGAQSVVASNSDLTFATVSDLEVSGNGTLVLRNGAKLSVPDLNATNVPQGTVDMGVGSRLVLASADLTVTSGMTLVKDGPFGASDQFNSLTVQSGGVVTHAVRDTAGLRLNVTGKLDVQGGGLIDVSGKGLLGGSGGNSPGETFDGSDNIVAGAGSGGTWAAGASYGGSGGDGHQGVTGAPYGLLENPRYLGAGGGGAASAPTPNGGGRLWVSAGTMVLDGIVRADGLAGQFPNGVSGGGAGGSIRLDVGTLSGSGTISAKGGNGANGGQWYSGAGGGGRIAVYYGALTLPATNLGATGGTGSSPGGAGTIYLKDNAASAGDVIVDNANVVTGLATRLMTRASALRTVTVRNQTLVNVLSGDVSALAITQQLQVASGSTATLNSGETLTFTAGPGYQVEVQGGGTLTVPSGVTLAASGGALAAEVQGGGTLTLAAGATWSPQRVRVNGANSVVTSSSDLAFPVATDLELSGGGTLAMRNGAKLSAASLGATNVPQGTVDMGVGSRLDLVSADLTITGGMTLVKDGPFGASDQFNSLTVQSGGVVTHAVRDTAGLRLDVSGTLTVDAGGLIDLDEKGLLGGSGGNSPGETFDGSDNIVAGAGSGGTWAAGASYGGSGGDGHQGVTGAPYGLLENPRYLGAGGGGAASAPRPNGGGRLRVSAGAMVLNGIVRADGASGQFPNGVSGGGAGGSIRLDVGTLSGSGTITAKGGNGANGGQWYSGAGGGGRIAVYYGTLGLPSANFLVAGGTGTTPGGSGTIYLKDGAASAGDVIVDNANVESSTVTGVATGLATLRSVTLRNAARLSLDATQRITGWIQAITLANATLSAPDTLRLLGTTLSGTGTVAARVANGGTISPGTPGTSPGTLVLSSDYQQTEGGTLHADVAGAGSYAHLHVGGAAQLGGRLDFAYLNGYAPPGTARFPVLSYGSHTGTFSTVTGNDAQTSVLYGDSTTTLVPQDLAADHVAPDTQILTGPPAGGWSNANSVTLTWTGTDNVTSSANLHYAYRLDGGAFGGVTSATSATYGSIAEGPHTFDVYAVDEAANPDATPASRTFTVDRTAPTVAFGSGPANGDTIGTDSTRFTFSGADDRAPSDQITYAWALDGGAFTAPAASPALLAGLADGPHTLAVHGIDLAGNAGGNATRSFRVEATAPAVATVSGPGEGAHIGSTSAQFGWTGTSTSTPVGQITYRSALDAAPTGAFTRDTSASFGPLAATAHVLRIDARDRWGHVSQLARNFRVDTTPPSTAIASGPLTGWTNASSVSVGWTGTDDASAVGALRYAYRVDGGSYGAAASATSATLTGLAEGPHTVDVYAVDEAGNADASPASLAFTVDLTAPATQIVTGPADSATIAVNSAVYGLGGSDNFTPPASLRYQWQVDGGAWSAISSAPSALVNGMSDGTHRIAIRAVDLAGNPDPAPPARALTSDALPPVVTITAGPAANACQVADSATIAWSGSDAVTPPAGLVFATALDGAAPTAFDSSRVRTLTGLSEGTHTLVVQSRDLVNHLGSVSRTFTVDHTAPAAYTPTTRLLDNSTVGFQCTGTDNTGISGFHVQVAGDTTFGAPLLDVQLGAAGAGSYSGTPGHNYYARSQAVDCAGNASAWSRPSNGSAVANLADLIVTQVVVPPGLTAMQTFPVTYTVSNQGIGSTNVPQWSDDIYLSPTTTFDPGTAMFLARIQNQSALGPNESYSTTSNVTVPVGTSGTYYVLVVADNGNQVPESDGGNNLRASAVIPVALGDYADLVVTKAVAPPTALSGTPVTVRWTVKNQGTGRTNTDRWWDTVMLSSDSLFDYALVGNSQLRVLDSPVGAFEHVGALDPGQSYDVVTTVTVPGDVSGRRFVLVTSDLNASSYNQTVSERGNVFENVAEVNWAAAESTVVTQQQPSDLVALGATAGSTASTGGGLPVSWTVRNGGFNATPAVSWDDRVWLSDDAYYGGDILLGTVSHAGPLALDSSYTASAVVGIPNGLSGEYTVFVQVDANGAVAEYRGDNNIVQAAGTVQVTQSPWPNLRLLSGVVPDTVAAGAVAVVQWTGTNTGVAALNGSWSDDVVLSQSPTWNGSGTGMGGARLSQTLARYQTYTAQTSFTVPPTWSGRWYVYARTDVNNEVYENINEGDNVLAIGSFYVRPYPPVDLVVADLSVPATAAAGGVLPVSYTVKNQGDAQTIASGWGEEIWLSADTQLGAGDILLFSPGHGGALPAQASYDRTYSPGLANGFSGTYYVIVRTDPGGATGDANLANNTTVSATPVVFTAVSPPDLVVRGLATPAAATAGQPIHLSWSVNNAGQGAVPAGSSSSAAAYLSLDPYLDGSDLLLATWPTTGGLAPGASDPESLDVTLPTWVSGGYYVIVAADIYNQVWEAADGNNAALLPMAVTLAPPADLVVTDVQVPPVAIPGQTVSVSFTLANIGTNPAVGQLQNAVYASADSLFEASLDPLVGIETMNVSLAPGAARRFTQRMQFAQPLRVDLGGNVTGTLPPLTPGPYYAIVHTNIRANVRELDQTNNEAISAVTLRTDVDSLTLESPVVKALATGQAVFYRVMVQAAQDLTFTLASSDTNATNEMFVAYARTPSGNDYDFTGPPEFTDAPSVLVPGTQAGEYFVMVVARDLGTGPASEQVQLVARTLPFQVTSVSPDHAGRDGQVTLRVRGAGFRRTSAVKLKALGTPIATGRLVALTNTTDMLVRFDLSGIGMGAFDLEVANGPDASLAPIPLEVEPATPPAVDVGVSNADVVRRTATGSFTFTFTNTSNLDVPVLSARLLYPATSQLRRLETSPGLLRRSDRAPDLFPPLTGDASVVRRADGTDSLAAIDLVASHLSPGETRTVTLGLGGYESSPFSVRALSEVLTESEYLDQEVQRNETARRWLLANPAGVPTDVIAGAGDPMAFRDAALVHNLTGGGFLDSVEISDYLIAHSGQLPVAALPGSAGPPTLLSELTGGACTVTGSVPECRPDVGAVTSALPACRVCFDAAAIPMFERVGSGAVAMVPSPVALGYSATRSADVRVVAPCDPNNITGPAGYGDQRWVKAGDALFYTVDFENLATVASSPAQVVRVSVPLDPMLDLTTFRVGALGFGSNVISTPVNRSSYSTEQFYSSLGLQVLVTCGVDVGARRANWTLTSIDPATGQQPTNPYIGFLAVNDLAGRGLGYVTYTIKPLAGSASGTQVRAQASIQFDANVPVATSTAVNRLDSGAPSSAVLPNLSVLDSTHVRVNWASRDDSTGSGPAGVSLYMAQDGVGFSLVGDKLTTGQVQLPVNAGHYYSFYTLATDNVGNAEPAKLGADAGVVVGTVQLGVDSLRTPRVTMFHPAYPNPCRGLAMVRFDLARAGAVSLEVFDVQGRRVLQPLDNKRFAAGTHTLALTGLPRAAGVYFLRMRAERYSAVRRIVIIQ